MTTTTNTLGNKSAISDLLNKTKNKNQTSNRNLEYITVHHSEIISNPQVRTIFDKASIESLAESIKINGQQELVSVFPKNEDGFYVIERGERRWRALQFLDANVDIRIVAKKEGLQLVVAQLIENIQREDLQPIEVSNALKTLVDMGLTQADICKQISKSKSYVSRILSLQNLDEDIKQLANKNIVTEVETLSNLNILKKHSKDTFNNTVKLVKTGKLTRELSRELVFNIKKNEIDDNPKIQPNNDSNSSNNDLEQNNKKQKKSKKILVINVSFAFDGKEHEGTLFLNKLPTENNMVYVVSPSFPKKSIPVYIDDVTLKTIDIVSFNL